MAQTHEFAKKVFHGKNHFIFVQLFTDNQKKDRKILFNWKNNFCLQ